MLLESDTLTVQSFADVYAPRGVDYSYGMEKVALGPMIAHWSEVSWTN